MFSRPLLSFLLLPFLFRQAAFQLVEPLSESNSLITEYTPPPHPGNQSRTRIPSFFDARFHWPDCASVISLIGRQGNCSTCWAFAVAGAISDRICIASQGILKPIIAPRDLVECTPGSSCNAGSSTYAWLTYRTTGYVTGSIDDTAQGCKPYRMTCPAGAPCPRCTRTCSNADYPVPYHQDRHVGQRVEKLSSGSVEDIQRIIMKSGPVTSVMIKSALPYSRGRVGICEGSQVRHTVRIIGWGQGSSGGGGYWLIANSWGANWNGDGTAQVRYGAGELGDVILFGTPKL